MADRGIVDTSLIGGRYEILSRLGKGGMGEVYRVRDTRLLREVAMKILTHAADSEQALFYFHREARAVAALRHPGIVQIFDYSGPDESPPFIVMDLVAGGDLIGMLEEKFPLPEFVIVAIIYGVASALAHAHEHGVVHRDIKPANVLLEPSGRVLLTDFGLAKAYRDPDRLGKTLADRATRLFGTADFLAPEQITDEESSPDSDVFALGSLLYWLCVGTSPFADIDPVICMRKVVAIDKPPLRRVRPELSEAVAALLDDCHRAEPYLRPSSSEVRSRCRAWFADHQVPNAVEELEEFLSQKIRETTQVGLPKAKAALEHDTDPEPSSARFAEAPTEVDSGPRFDSGPTVRERTEILPAPSSHTEPLGRLSDALPSVDFVPLDTTDRFSPPPDTNPGRPVARSGGMPLERGPAALPEPTPRSERDDIVVLSVVKSPPKGPPAPSLSAPVSAPALAVSAPVSVPISASVSTPVSAPAAVPVSASPPPAATPSPGRGLGFWFLVTLLPAVAVVAGAWAFKTKPWQRPAPAVAAAEAPPAAPSRPTPPSTVPRGEGGTGPPAPEEPPSDPPVTGGVEDKPSNPESPRDKGKGKSKRRRGEDDEAIAPSRPLAPPRPVAPPSGPVPKVKLEIFVDPWGKVYLDGRYVGNTPKLQVLEATPGRHVVRAEHPQLGVIEEAVVFGQESALDLEFERE